MRHPFHASIGFEMQNSLRTIHGSLEFVVEGELIEFLEIVIQAATSMDPVHETCQLGLRCISLFQP